MSDDNSKHFYRRLAEEMAEADTPQARYQAVLDRHWETMRDLEFEENDLYQVGGFMERWSQTPSFTKGRRDSDWRVR
jgi:hypothetical protein